MSKLKRRTQQITRGSFVLGKDHPDVTRWLDAWIVNFQRLRTGYTVTKKDE
jgi:hypothetical protein